MNKSNFIGRWTKDVELAYTPGNGTAVARGSLAVKSKRKNADGTYASDFIPVKAFGKTAELLANSDSGRQGHLIGLSGHMISGKYTDKKHSDVTHYTLEFVVDEITFVEKKDGSSAPQPNKSNNQFSGAMDFGGSVYEEEMTPIDDGDIPF